MAAGTSGVGILWLIFHFWHVTSFINDLAQNDNEEKMRRNATTIIIVTDSSTGKKAPCC
ncbi:hypothetical protein [Ferruginibacter profundus]